MHFDKTPIGCPDTSVMNYHYSLHNNPEERSSHVYDVLLITLVNKILAHESFIVFLT